MALTSATVTIGVRPNDLDIGTEGGLDATVEFVEELGSEAFLYCVTQHHGHEVVARTDGLSSLRAGDRVSLVPKPGGVHLFDAETGARLVA